MTDPAEYLNAPQDEFHLACLLLSPTGTAYLGHALDAVHPGDFYDSIIGWMWSAARTIHGSGARVTKRALLALRDKEYPRRTPDAAPVADASLPLNAPAAPSLRARLEQISGEPVYTGRLQASVRAVTQSAKMRRLVETLDRAKSHAITAEDYSQALNLTHELLGKLEESELPADAVPFSDLVDDFNKSMTGGLSVGEVIPTPWDELNELLSGGLHPGRSFVVAGRPGHGKSNAGLNMASHAAEQGFPTLVISEEMSGLEVTGRLMASGARVEYSEITRFAMGPDTQAAVSTYGEENRGMPLWVVDRPSLTIEHISAIAHSLKRRHGLGLLVIDYLQLLGATDRRVIREQQVAHISKSIKDLSRDLGCAVVTAAQLNRDNVKSNRRPTIADLRESGSIEQDADAVILLHHEETEEGLSTGMVTLIVAKSRFGRKDDVELRWRGNQARMGD